LRLLALGLGAGLRGELEESVRVGFPGIQAERRAVRIDVNAETLDYQYA
jgi:hypothetical protein